MFTCATHLAGGLLLKMQKYFEVKTFLKFPGHTIKPGTAEHGSTEHETPAEHWRNSGTLAEHRNTGETTNTGETIGILHNSGT